MECDAQGVQGPPLLYAQRLVKFDNASAWSLRHRAYAKALAGLHAAALADLAARARLPRPAQDEQPAPAWELLVEAYCRYDAQAVQGHDGDDVKELAALISYLIYENNFIRAQQLTTGRKVLKLMPECYAVCDSMARYQGRRIERCCRTWDRRFSPRRSPAACARCPACRRP